MQRSPKAITINRIMFALSIAGLVMGIYVLQSFLRQTSVVCLTGGGCDAVRKSAASWPFGMPVPAVGVVGYAVLVVLTFLRTASSDRRLLAGILGMTAFGVSFVSWFTYTELFVIKGICMWCAISAVNMYILFGLALAAWKEKNVQ